MFHMQAVRVGHGGSLRGLPCWLVNVVGDCLRSTRKRLLVQLITLMTSDFWHAAASYNDRKKKQYRLLSYNEGKCVVLEGLGFG